MGGGGVRAGGAGGCLREAFGDGVRSDVELGLRHWQLGALGLALHKRAGVARAQNLCIHKSSHPVSQAQPELQCLCTYVFYGLSPGAQLNNPR